MGFSSGGGGGGASPANPTGVVGLTAVNGSAATFLRSDGAPPLNQGITPTWTSTHEWSLAEPRLLLNESDQGTNLKLWDIDLNSGVLAIRTRTDADGAGSNAIAITRGATTALTDISVGAGTSTFHFLGTGLISIANAVTAQGTITGVGNIVGQGALIQSSRSTPAFAWSATGQSTNLKNWLFAVSGTTLTLGTATDATTTSIAKAALTIVRGTTTVVGSIAIGNSTDNPPLTINGAITLAGSGATTGAQTATFSATNKPGSNTGAPTIWIPIVIASTTYWVPGFAN